MELDGFTVLPLGCAVRPVTSLPCLTDPASFLSALRSEVTAGLENPEGCVLRGATAGLSGWRLMSALSSVLPLAEELLPVAEPDDRCTPEGLVYLRPASFLTSELARPVLPTVELFAVLPVDEFPCLLTNSALPSRRSSGRE